MLKSKLLLFFLFLYLSKCLNSQVLKCEYSIKVEMKLANQNSPQINQINLILNAINDGNGNIYLETFLNNDESEVIQTGKGNNRFLLRPKSNDLYSIGQNGSVEELNEVKTDTLIYSGKTQKDIKTGLICKIYNVKNNDKIKIYASKELSSQINPGISINSNDNIGAIVSIVIIKDDRIITYKLLKYAQNKGNLEKYLDLAGKYNGKKGKPKSMITG